MIHIYSEKRYGVGCRTLVYKSAYHMLPGLLSDLTDWQIEPRKQASRLLVTLILNAEKCITQYAEKVISTLIIALADDEKEVVKNVSIFWFMYNMNVYDCQNSSLSGTLW